MTSMPVVAIVGRPNVGKSSLLNALAGRRISIVQDTPGVTRDRVSCPLNIDGRYIELVDTGGYGFEDPDHLTEHIHRQIELAMKQADLVLLLVDCQEGLTAADQQIASLLRRQGISTVLVANKADGARADLMLADFARLGMGTPIGVSALHHRNLDAVLDAIRQRINLAEAPAELPEPRMLVAIVGKRNAGKSTLVNAIASLYEGQSERVIVSEVPGTTRDSIDVRVEKDGQVLVVIDTAGVRKKRHMVTDDIAYYSFHRAQRSVRRADVVLLLIDATEPVSEPDKKLASYVEQQHKPVIIVVNKWDLARQAIEKQRRAGASATDDRRLMDEFRQYLAQELPHLSFAPIAFVTAKEGRNVQAVLDLAQKLFKQAATRVTTGQLNQAVRSILQQRAPGSPGGRRAKVFYASQIDVLPPTIALVVNDPELIDAGYQRFIVNRLRELLPYPQVPIRLLIRPRTGRSTPADETPLDEPPRQSTPARSNARRASSSGKTSKPTARRGRPALRRPRR